MAVGVDNVEEADDVRVVHFFEEGDFANGGRWDAFIFGFKTDLLQCNDPLVFGGEVAGLVNNAIST